MTRLSSEFQRLYVPASASDALGGDPLHPSLLGRDGTVRALVFELGGAAGWNLLSLVWRGVQAELDLPPPAIAVSGHDAFQLWFSLAEPVPVAQAHAFLELLRIRFLPEVPQQRIRLRPAPKALAPGQVELAQAVPAEQPSTGNWSAFLAPDLAPVFNDTPWLDIPQSEDGQADLLRRLDSIKVPEFEAALDLLRPAPPEPLDDSPGRQDHLSERSSASPLASGRNLDPRRFLQQVLNDPHVALALRIEAAKALLGDSRD